MSTDLIFSILPREGKVPIAKEELRVKKVEKDPKLRPLNDEEKGIHADDRDAREKYQKHHSGSENNDKQDEQDDAEATTQVEQSGVVEDENGQKHLDIYI